MRTISDAKARSLMVEVSGFAPCSVEDVARDRATQSFACYTRCTDMPVGIVTNNEESTEDLLKASILTCCHNMVQSSGSVTESKIACINAPIIIHPIFCRNSE